MVIPRLTFSILVAIAPVFAADFSIEIASPVAANVPLSKTSIMVARTQGCDSAKPQITGTAEGLVKGERKSVPLKLTELRPGVFGVNDQWGEGAWVLNLVATCASATAGAIVPVGPHGFNRADSKFFPRAPTSSEIDAALKTRTAKP